MAEQSVVPIDQLLPNKLPLVALMGRPIFPGIFTPIMIGNPADVKVVDAAVSGDGLIGLVMLLNESDNPSITDLYKVGTAAKIVKKINLPDGGVNIFISTLKRFQVKKALHPTSPIVAAVEYMEDVEDETAEVKALTRALISEMKQISENNPLFSEEMRLNMINIDHPGKIADFIASILNIDKAEQQKILEILNVRKRMEQVLIFIKKEQELLRIQKKIQKEINEKIEKSQREYFLKEELKAIKSELGMATDAKSSEYQRFKEKIDAFKFEGEIKEAVEQELEKFSLMDPNSGEFIVTRNYLDMISSLPWNDPAPESFDLKKAEKILEEDHYGLKDVKSRIVEYLAVRKLRNAAAGSKGPAGSIICLVGPPGVGKTSVGKSIARSLGKQFFRFSVGGMRDEAEIKGHRRTYIGAMPGKIIQGLKIVKTKDPVFMIDEIDKMGQSYQGDPASALLEVLDPEQNNSFRDHYLDLPFDISHIFFIITANTLDTIPVPLIDRMEIIQLPGYIDREKLEIAKRYLVPKSLEKSGLKKNQVKYTQDSLLHIANGYAREAGVRNFEKNLDKIHRKLAKQIVEAEESGMEGDKKFAIEKKLIEKHLGKPIFPEGDVKKADRPGMSVGLAWTSMGGDTLVIEATSVPGKEGFTLTGMMGDTMKESAAIAMTLARKLAIERYSLDASWFEKNHVHLHIPEGATPKDGPSAGITMATALLSLMRGKTIVDRLVMTGELSLTGQVLPIGGLKEKTIAAQRNKARHIIIPKQNMRDLDDIPDHVKKGIEFHPVERFDEVLALALPD
ncbi:endopeptidase La [Leadbettera azotonutricia]|uniref:Lon protease n=1 Tax=Leadbettera azotonutricia (strain ATCC BAA-888 / DSM 13862 / ZAS-9) TaxID=545695 RepID=F5Y794_LEAAZ|nr:endopeptidase La [Leadbettera azotonutricia]AEF82965.1 endopeptidase La [Leadbettera azotonutricia ZAS-9]